MRENKPRQKAGTALEDDDANIGSTPKGIVYTLESTLGTDKFRKRRQLQLINGTENLSTEIKKVQLNSLKSAQKRLSEVLKCNAGEALEKLTSSLIKKIDENLKADQQNDSETEQCGSITDKITVKVNTLKTLFCTITKRFEDECKSQALKESLPLYKQKFEAGSNSVIESLKGLNHSMKKFENDTKSIVDVLTNYHDYQKTLDALKKLLEESNSSSCNPQFYLDLMGCDWARHLKAMDNDIEMGKNNYLIIYMTVKLHNYILTIYAFIQTAVNDC